MVLRARRLLHGGRFQLADIQVLLEFLRPNEQPDRPSLAVRAEDLRGHEVLARLRLDEITRDIPVVVISADATARQIQRLMAAGARSYLTKPLDIGEFFRVIDEAMRTRIRKPEAAAA